MKRMQIILLGVFFSSKIVSQDIDLRVDTSEYLKSREYDTIANGIAGNNHFEFNYKTSQIIKKYTTEKFEDINIKIKNYQILYVDLYDDCTCNKYQEISKVRNVRVYMRDGYMKIFTYESGNKSLKFDGSEIAQVVIEKP